MKDRLYFPISLQWLSKYRDVLFGFSIISIMIFHWCEVFVSACDSGVLWAVAEVYILFVGSIGVEIFLFLSGIGLCFSMHRDKSIRNFYMRRAMRILPKYLVGGSTYWVIKDIVIQGKGIMNVLYDLFFCSFLIDGNTTYWYFLLILVLYLVYPLVFRLFETDKNKSFVRMLAVALVIILFIWAMFLFDRGMYENLEIALWRIPVFLVGAYVGERIYNQDNFDMVDLSAFIAGFVIKILACVYSYGLLIGRPFGLLSIFRSRLANTVFSISLIYIVVFIIEKMKNCKWFIDLLSMAGRASLSLYIAHIATRGIAMDLGLPVWNIWCYIICMALAGFFAFLLEKIKISTARSIHA